GLLGKNEGEHRKPPPAQPAQDPPLLAYPPDRGNVRRGIKVGGATAVKNPNFFEGLTRADEGIDVHFRDRGKTRCHLRELWVPWQLQDFLTQEIRITVENFLERVPPVQALWIRPGGLQRFWKHDL